MSEVDSNMLASLQNKESGQVLRFSQNEYSVFIQNIKSAVTVNDFYTDISPSDTISLDKTFDCGQCFRFEKIGNYHIGVAFGRLFCAESLANGVIRIYSPKEDILLWLRFLALDEDYSYIRSTMPTDDTMTRAKDIADGIRILRQDKWEAICSFIISQNNNIPRIKKLISTLCRTYGTPITVSECLPESVKNAISASNYPVYSFPDAKTLASISESELYKLKFGFRAPYIIDAAITVSERLDLEEIETADFENAANELMTIKGVGPKVAACALLFGFHKTDAFPIDVWVKRILEKYYPDLLPRTAADYFAPYAGIAQQYLFYYERYTVGKDD